MQKLQSKVIYLPNSSLMKRCRTNYLTGINSQHEVYEDLGINSGSAVDSSFNADNFNFNCENLPENDPLRALSFECSLSGSLGHIKGHARQLSSGRQTPYSVPGLTGSPTSSASFAPVTTTASPDNLMGVYEPISELVCTTTGGPCLGEQGELGFATTNAGSPKRRYWLDEGNAHLAPFPSNPSQQQQQPVYQCTNVGLRSSELLDQQACTAASNPATNDFQLPSWDQIPEHLQNLTSSAEYNASGVSTSAAEGDMSLPWDDTMDFAMDMDMDLNIDLAQL